VAGAQYGERRGAYDASRPNDGASTTYGIGDLWVLRYHASEIDDGEGFTTDPA
jgi:hypothetical protein